MILGDVIDRMSGPDRLHIVTEENEVIYNGYQGNFHFSKVSRKAEVLQLGLFMNVFRRDKRSEMLASTEGHVPLPDNVTDIAYGDLETCIYHKIVIKKE